MNRNEGLIAPAVSPLWELLKLALPTIAQMASYTFMQFADTWMLAQVGDLPATAAGQAGMFQFALLSFGFGILLLVNTLVSQADGRGDRQTCGRAMWQGIHVGVVYGLLMLALVPFSRSIFLGLKHEPALAAFESTYFNILTYAATLKLAGTAVTQFMIGIQRATLVMISAIVGVLLNLVFNYLLIFGKLGFPEMGLAGAAWATVIAMTAELLILLAFAGSKSIRATYAPFDFRVRLDLMKTLLKLGIPAGAALAGEVSAWSLFNVCVIAEFGTDAMTANNYAFRFMLISFMPAIGIGQAVTALVGRYVGMRKFDEARRRGHLGFAVAAGYMVTCGAVLIAFRKPFMSIFTDDPNVVAIGAVVLCFVGAYQILDAMYVTYTGGLRGAGDTFVPAMVMIGANWTLTVGVALAVANFLPQFGVAGPWTVLCVYGVVVGVFNLLRFRSRRWERRALEADGQADKVLVLPDVEAERAGVFEP